jgi:hypothetical protein
MTEHLILQKHYKLSPKLAELLLMLAQNDVLTTAVIEGELGVDAKSTVHRLRERLTSAGIEVHSLYATGYWLDADARRAVLEAAKPEDLEKGV